MIEAALRGAAARAMRRHERAAFQARWAGVLAQADMRKLPSLDRMLGRKPPAPAAMDGRQIGAAMRAWAARSG